jgi:glycosyltransferase involved in cell wall biosynthesis
VVDRRVPVRALNFAWHRIGWPPAEWLTGMSFDVVQSAHPLLVPASHAAQIVTICDLDFLDHPERTRAEIRRDYPSLAGSHARRADGVIVISRFTAREVEHRLGVPASRIAICYPGAPDWAAREQEPARGSVLFLGTLEPRKNLGVLLDAYERLLSLRPDAPNLVLAGHAAPEAGSLVARTRQPPLAGHVEVLGYVAPDRRVDVFRQALVFVLPSHAEGFGMPALEAMTCGVPVIVANRAALPEVVGDAGRLFEPDDAGGLATALAEVLGDVQVRNRMREAGWLQARRFQWRESAMRAREAWAMAVERRRQRGG